MGNHNVSLIIDGMLAGLMLLCICVHPSVTVLCMTCQLITPLLLTPYESYSN